MGGSSNKNTAFDSMGACINGYELLVEILPSSKFDVCQSHAYSEYSQRDPKQLDRFVLSYTQHDVKSNIFVDLPVGFGVEGAYPREWVNRLYKNLY